MISGARQHRLEPGDITSERTSVTVEDADVDAAPAVEAAPAVANGGVVIQSVSRAFRLLEVLAEAGGDMRLQDIAAAAGLKGSTCHHLLNTLVVLGYVMRNSRTKAYGIGARMHEIAQKRGAQMDLTRDTQPMLDELARDTGATVVLAAMSGTSLNVIRQAGQPAQWHAAAEQIAAASHATAIGKAILAWLPETEIARVVADYGMTCFTPRTIVSLGDLVESLRQIRRHGFALDDEEFRAGLTGVACALRGPSGVVVGSVGLLIESSGVPEAEIRALQLRLAQGARKISASLL